MAQRDPAHFFLPAILIGFALGAGGYVIAARPVAEAQTGEVQLYDGVPLDFTLLKIDKEALDEAYHRQLLLLFEVWLKGDTTEDQRIKAGLRKARSAYNSAAQQINKREQQLLEQTGHSQPPPR